MLFKRTVGPKGQVVIPKDLREHLGLKTGSRVVFEVRGDVVVVKPETDPREWVEQFVAVVQTKRRREVDLEKVAEDEASDEFRLYR